jgi:tetratricopeptide (TPR) repeat protein
LTSIYALPRFDRSPWTRRPVLWTWTLTLLLVVTACSKDPQTVKARAEQQGDALMEQGKTDEAIIQYRNAVQAVPTDGPLRLKLADALWKTDRRRAAGEYVRAADLLTDRVDVQLKAGNLLLAGGRFDDAKVRAEKAIAIDPKNVEARIVLANSLAGLKDLEAAIDEIEEAIRLAPTRGNSYSDLGNFQAVRGKHEEAERAYKKAIEIDERSAPAHLALANYYWVRQRWTDSEQSLRRALEVDPDNLLAHRALASLAFAMNRPAEAESHLKRVAELTKAPESILALADFYIAQNDLTTARNLLEPLAKDKAMSALANIRLAKLDHAAGDRDDGYARVERVLAGDPGNVQALLAKTAMLLADNRADAAVLTAQKAADADPNSASAFYALGRAAEDRREYDKATKAYEDALRVNPRATGAQVALARLHLRQGRAPAAVTMAENALKTEPDNPDARLALVRGLIARGDLKRGETELAKLSAQYPNSVAVRIENGVLLGRRKDLVGSRREFDQALKLAPDSAEALNGLLALDLAARRPEAARARIDARIKSENASPALLMVGARTYAATGDLTAAEQLLRRILQKDPANMNAYSALGEIYLKQKRLDAALAEFDNVAQKDPKSVAAPTVAGMILAAQGKPAEARKRYERALQADPAAPVAANNLAWMYAESGENLDVALQLAQAAYGSLPSHPDVTDTLGFIYYKKNLLPQAQDMLRKTVEKAPANPLYHYHLGLVLAKMGNTDGAKEHLTQALKLKPDFEGSSDAKALLQTMGGQ